MGSLSDLFKNEVDKIKQTDPEPVDDAIEIDKPADGKKRVLFICTGNSVRSQMAEALLKSLGSDKFEVYSAGITPAGVHRLTKQVMGEVGISMDGHHSQHVSEYETTLFDYVIPLCEVAALSCPEFPGEHQRINWYIDDPIRVLGGDERKLTAFRITRNILKKKVLAFIQEAA
ncbi:arsenate reductase ArsC [bacterium]|nr:arsenate reductase ArsC [bacterium]MBU1633100.1 arsenate reductase ArsC [bacterium]MBU1874280.1 arsenate reductase ArsC [bacterium]